jgi:hypothetical protein
MRRVLFFVLPVCVLVACGGASSQQLGPDDSASSSGGSGSSSGGSSSGGSSSGGNDGGGTDAKSDAFPGKDGGGSSSGAPDTGPPPNGVITTQITITDLFENCQPIVAADPITMKGSITIGNGTSTSIGPISFPGGTFLNPQGHAVIAGFKLQPVTMGAVGSGQSLTVDIEKQQNSAEPSNACATLPCGGQVIVEVNASGPGIPANARITTNPIKVGCAL